MPPGFKATLLTNKVNRGIHPLAASRNGKLANLNAVQALENQIHMIASRRVKTLWRQWIHPHWLTGIGTSPSFWNPPPGAADGYNIFRFRFRTSPNVKGVRVTFVSAFGDIASPNPGGSLLQPSFSWKIGPTGAPVTQATINRGDIKAHGSTVTLNDLAVHHQEFVDASGDPLVGNTVYDGYLTVYNGARVCGATIYEIPRLGLDGSENVYVPGIVARSPVLNTHVDELWTACTTMWKQMGPQLIGWAPNIDGSNITSANFHRRISSSTFTNILNGSTSGHSANAASFYVYTHTHNYLTATTTPVALWCYASVPSGTGGEVKFTDSNGTIGTITGIGTTAGYFQTTANLTVTGASGDNVIIEAKDTAGSPQINIYAAGMYEYAS